MKFRIRKRRKGFTLATCIATLAVISVLTSVVLFSVTLENASFKLEKTLLEQKVEVAQLGESFLSGALPQGESTQGAYVCFAEGNVLTVKNADLVTLLVVEKGDDGAILKWLFCEQEEALL